MVFSSVKLLLNLREFHYHSASTFIFTGLSLTLLFICPFDVASQYLRIPFLR